MVPMPYQITFLDDGQGALQQGSGILHGEEILAELGATFSENADLSNLCYSITDVTEVDEVVVSSEYIRLIAEFSHGLSKRVTKLVGVIVAPEPLLFGLGRMYQGFSSTTGWTQAAYHSRAEALEFIRDQLPTKRLSFK